jgi:hypothetical protein
VTDVVYPHRYLRDPLHLATAYEQIGTALTTMAAGRASWPAGMPSTADLAVLVTALCDVVTQTTDEARVRAAKEQPTPRAQQSIGMLSRAATHAATAINKLVAELHGPVFQAGYAADPRPQYQSTGDTLAHILWLHISEAADSMGKAVTGLRTEYHKIGYAYLGPTEQVRGLEPVPLTASPPPAPRVHAARSRSRRATVPTVARQVPVAAKATTSRAPRM